VHDETLDDTGSNDTLLGIEVGTRLIDEVDIGRDTKSQDDSDTLQFTTGQVLDFLVDEVIHLQGLVDIGLELRVQEGGLDLLEEELTDGTLEFGSDLLGLHTDVHGRNTLSAIRLLGTSEHSTESGLSGTVLSHHDEDLGIGELTGLNLQLETGGGLCLVHGRVAILARLVDEELLSSFTDTELQRFLSETQVLAGNVTVEENVDTLTDRRRQGDDTVDGRLTVKQTDEVGQVVENGQIVLDDNDVRGRAEQTADQTTGGQTLLDIQEG